jgi:hypothetical protein
MKRAALVAGLLIGCGDAISLGDGVPMPGNDAAQAGAGGVASDGHIDAAIEDASADVSVDAHPFEPCAGRVCGDPCHTCAPTDPQCVEPPDPQWCSATGDCTPHQGPCG